MKIIILLLLLFSINGAILGQGSEKHMVYFETSSSDISASEKDKLKSFFELFDKSKIAEIILKGHTDSDGEDDYNDRLSDNRTKSVKIFLLVHGLISSTEESFGEKKPLNANSSDLEKSRNRRVEITVNYLKGGLLADNDFKILAYRNLPTSEYCIDPTRDTILNLARGGRVIFKANTFTSDGKCVTITAKEAYSKSEIVLANLSTLSNGNLLESGGMVFLEAQNSSGKVLNSQKDFTVQMPTNDFKEGMMIFNGEHTADSTLNWLQGNSGFTPDLQLANGCFDKEGDLNQPATCDKCGFFFCRIKRIVKPFVGMVNVSVRSDNKQLRQCQRAMRRARRMGNTGPVFAPGQPALPVECQEIQAIMDSLGLKNYKEYNEWRIAERNRIFKENLKAGKASINEVALYSMTSNRMGWINCDRFYAMPPEAKIVPVIATDEEENRLVNAQCTIVLEDGKSVIGSTRSGKKFSFIGLPKKMAVFVIAVMMKQGKIFLSMERAEIQDEMPALNFKEVSYDELVAELGKLD